MEISFKTINENMDDILNEFSHSFLEEGNYAKCEKILKDIFNIFSLNGEIQLDINEGYDNNFHELYSKIKEIIDSREDKVSDTALLEMENTFDKVTKEVFKTAEVRKELSERDITNDIYINALKNGVIEATKAQKPYDSRIRNLQQLTKNIVGEDDLVKQIKESQKSIASVKGIIEKYDKIEQLSKVIDSLNSDDKLQIEACVRRRLELYNEINEDSKKINDNKLIELDIEKIDQHTPAEGKAYLNTVISKIEKDKALQFTGIINNMKNVKKDGDRYDIFKDVKLDELDPSKEKDQKQIFALLRKIEILESKFELKKEFYQKQVEIYEHQITLVQEETKIVDEIASKETVKVEEIELPEDIEKAKEDDLEFYSEMVRAQMYGDKKMQKKYDQCIKLFLKASRMRNTREIEVKDINGKPVFEEDGVTPKKVDIRTIDYNELQEEIDKAKSNSKGKDLYPDTAEDMLKFLQLEQYKNRMEFNERYRLGDKSVLRELKGYSKVISAKNEEERNAAILELENIAKKIVKDNQHYIDTYHNAVNDVKTKIKHHSTAGKYGETKLPMTSLKNAETFGEKFKAAMNNIKAFSRVENPKNVKGFFRKSLVVASDAMNIITFLPRGVVKFIGLTVSDQIGYLYRDVKSVDHVTILPNPYKGRKDARREARVDYYREQGDSRFVARVKGWSDDYVPFAFKGRRKDIENSIIDRQIAEIKANIDGNYAKAIAKPVKDHVQEQRDKFIKEIKVSRTDDFKRMAASKEVMEDIFKDTDNAKADKISERIIQRLALEYEGMDSSFLEHTGTYSGALNEKRKNKFKKESETYEEKRTIKKPEILEEPIEFTRPKITEYGVVNADPIGNAVRDTALRNSITLLYTIPYLTMLTAENVVVKKCVNVIIDSIKPPIPEVPDVTEPVVPETTVPDSTFDPNVENLADDVTLGDIKSGKQAYFDYQGNSGNPSVSWVEAPSADNLQAIAFDAKIPEKGWSEELYNQLRSIGVEPGDRLYYTIADKPTHEACKAMGREYANNYLEGTFNVSDDTLVVDLIKEHTPDKYDKALDIILNSPEMAGKKGVEFLNDGFKAAYGKNSIIDSGKGLATGWDINAKFDYNQIVNESRANASMIGEIVNSAGENVVVPKTVEQLSSPSAWAQAQVNIPVVEQKKIKILETILKNKMVGAIRIIKEAGALIEVARRSVNYKSGSDRECYKDKDDGFEI